MKLADFRDKEKFLKSAEEKRFLTYRGKNSNLASYISTETKKGWHDIFSIVNEEKNMQPRILYRTTLLFKLEREI